MLRTTLAVVLVASTSAYRLDIDQLAQQTGASSATAKKEVPEIHSYYKGDECYEKCWPELFELGQTSRMRQCKLCYCNKQYNEESPRCNTWNAKMQDADFAKHFTWTIV